MKELNGTNGLVIYNSSGEVKYQEESTSLVLELVENYENRKKKAEWYSNKQKEREKQVIREKYGDKVYMFQNALLRANKELDNRELRVFLYFLGKLDFGNKLKGISQVKIAEEVELSRENVNQAIKGLKTKGFIEIQKEGTSNYYKLNSELLWKGSVESHIKELKEIDFTKEKEKREEKTRILNKIEENTRED